MRRDCKTSVYRPAGRNNRDLRGDPHRWGPNDDLFSVDSGHPLFVAEINRALSAMMDKGVEWVYFDNP